MIADVVSANQGIPADEVRSGMSAHFNGATQAARVNNFETHDHGVY
jgi:hypothetical protein